MGTIEIVYLLSEKGRKLSLLAGGDGRHVQAVKVPASRDLLELATVLPTGAAIINATGRGFSPEANGPRVPTVLEDWKANAWTGAVEERSVGIELDEPPADVAAWALTIPERNARRKAAAERDGAEVARHLQEMRAEEEATRRENLRQAIERLRAGQCSVDSKGQILSGRDGTGMVIASVHPSDPEHAEVTSLGEANRRRYAKEQEEKEAAKQAAKRRQVEEMLAWVETHGSARLRKAAAAGLMEKSAGAYRDERLALERPGWLWDDTDDEREILNPTEEQIDALLDARKTDPGARLVQVGIKGEVDYEDATVWKPAICSEFLGRNIVRFL